MKKTFPYKRNTILFIAGLLYTLISLLQFYMTGTRVLLVLAKAVLGLCWIVFANGFKLKRIVLDNRQILRFNSLGYQLQPIPIQEIKKANLHDGRIYIFYKEGGEFQITNKQMKMEVIIEFYEALQEEMASETT